MGLPRLQTSFRVFASNVRGLKEQTVSVAKATYPVAGFQSQEPSTAVGGRPRAWGLVWSRRGCRFLGQAKSRPATCRGIKNERHDKRPTCDNDHRVPEAWRL